MKQFIIQITRDHLDPTYSNVQIKGANLLNKNEKLNLGTYKTKVANNLAIKLLKVFGATVAAKIQEVSN